MFVYIHQCGLCELKQPQKYGSEATRTSTTCVSAKNHYVYSCKLVSSFYLASKSNNRCTYELKPKPKPYCKQNQTSNIIRYCSALTPVLTDTVDSLLPTPTSSTVMLADKHHVSQWASHLKCCAATLMNVSSQANRSSILGTSMSRTN